MQKSVTKPQVEGNLNLQTVNRLAPVRNKREGTMMSHVHVDRHGTSTRSSSRIPTTLQNVILSSNRGNEVHVPPPKNVAYKVFFRGWLGRTFSSESKAGGKPSKSGQKKNIQLLVEEASEIKNQESNPTKHANSRPVLARRDSNSTLTPAPDRRSTKVTRKKSSSVPSFSPQQYLDAMISSRGYCVKTFATLEFAYHNKPTPLQLASYGVYLLDLVKSADADGLRSALASGLSRNPCNVYGESTLHRICRLGDTKLLTVMLDAGCDVQIADDYGRTPLHDACWAAKPAFDVVEMLMERDSRLFYMADCRGALPLSYVRKEHWALWLQFLESKKDAFWPRGGGDPSPPPLTLHKPNTRPVPLPESPLTLELARMVANGRMTPAEAQFLNSDVQDDDDDEDDTQSEGSDSDDDDPDDSESSNADISWEDEMKQVLNSLTSKGQPLAWSQ